MVEDPLDRHVEVLVDAAGLLVQLLDLWQAVEPSAVHAHDLAREVADEGQEEPPSGAADLHQLVRRRGRRAVPSGERNAEATAFGVGHVRSAEFLARVRRRASPSHPRACR